MEALPTSTSPTCKPLPERVSAVCSVAAKAAVGAVRVGASLTETTLTVREITEETTLPESVTCTAILRSTVLGF